MDAHSTKDVFPCKGNDVHESGGLAHDIRAEAAVGLDDPVGEVLVHAPIWVVGGVGACPVGLENCPAEHEGN